MENGWESFGCKSILGTEATGLRNRSRLKNCCLANGIRNVKCMDHTFNSAVNDKKADNLYDETRRKKSIQGNRKQRIGGVENG